MKSKAAALVFVLLCQAASLLACSGIPKGFCYVHAQRTNDVVLKGTLIASGTQSVQMEVLDVLSGTETRSVITIWDGKDINCTGVYSMKASYMANVGDTMLIILPKTIGIINAWDVIGDYRRPYYLFEEPILFVRTDTVYGLINGSVSYNPPYWSVQKMSYQSFKNYWTTHANDCAMLMGTAALQHEKGLQVSMFSNHVDVICSAEEKYRIQLFLADGRTILNSQGLGTANIYFETQPQSVCFLLIEFESGERFRRKYLLME